MTDEERQRQMEFILDTLARLTATTSQLAEMQKRADECWARDQGRLGRLEQSYVMLIELAQRHEERLDENDTRAANFSAALAELRRLVGQDGQQS